MSNAEFLEQVARGLVKISEPTLCQVGSTFYVWLSVLVDRSWSMSARCGRVNRPRGFDLVGNVVSHYSPLDNIVNVMEECRSKHDRIQHRGGPDVELQ